MGNAEYMGTTNTTKHDNETMGFELEAEDAPVMNSTQDVSPVLQADDEAAFAKQDPQGKRTRSMVNGKVYFSYADIYQTIVDAAERVKEFNPDVMVAIGGGGFIPARMLRTIINKPILAVSLELYD